MKTPFVDAIYSYLTPSKIKRRRNNYILHLETWKRPLSCSLWGNHTILFTSMFHAYSLFFCNVKPKFYASSLSSILLLSFNYMSKWLPCIPIEASNWRGPRETMELSHSLNLSSMFLDKIISSNTLPTNSVHHPYSPEIKLHDYILYLQLAQQIP